MIFLQLEPKAMDMSGELLTVKQCSKLLFNDTEQPAYKRTMRIIREAKLDTVKVGRVTYVPKSLLDSYFQLESCNEKEIGGINTHYDGETKSIAIHLPRDTEIKSVIIHLKEN
jgi:hypothetical protein